MSSSWSLSLTSQVPKRVVRLASVLSCPARLQNQLPSLLRASSAAPVAFESVGRHVSTNSSRKPTNTDWFSRATSSLALNYRFPMPSPHITRPVPLPNGSSEWELSKLAAAKLTGAGVLIVERSTAPIHTSAPLPSSASPSSSSSSSSSLLSSGNLVLFRRSGFDTWEEPGGCLKPEDEPLACAARELFEESCGTVSGEALSRHLLPRHLDVFGRSTASRYRTYFLDVPQGVLPTHELYETHREQMVEQSALKEFLETDGIIRVPLANVVECLPLHISTPPSSSGYVEVKDSEGVPRKISARTIKVLQQGGLIQLLGSLSML